MAQVVQSFPGHKPQTMHSSCIRDALALKLAQMDGIDPVMAAVALSLAEAVDQGLAMNSATALVGIARTSSELRKVLAEICPSGATDTWHELSRLLEDA